MPGERVWRNLLKSDPSVDLVHFTILRPPEKQDGIPVSELSLIAFPTRELFVEKINEFDLIIFDRYRMRGILPTVYIWTTWWIMCARAARFWWRPGRNLARLTACGARPLAEILPVEPTVAVIEEGFRPGADRSWQAPSGDRGAGGLAARRRLGPLVPPDRGVDATAGRW